MTIQEEITKAIGGHGAWKQRLRTAIDSGSSEFTPAIVCQDDQCAFGKWLGTVDQSIKASKRYNCVKAAHAEFHKEAARVLGLALAGKTQEAEKALSDASNFTALSVKLTTEMMGWKRES